MAATVEDSLRFVPSGVQGLVAVTEVAVFPNRLEVQSEGSWIVIRFLDIARWNHWLGWVYRPLARVGFKVRGCPSVADRDWFQLQGQKRFRFYTRIPLVIKLPGDSIKTEYHQTLFRRIQCVIQSGGFCTSDLG